MSGYSEYHTAGAAALSLVVIFLVRLIFGGSKNYPPLGRYWTPFLGNAIAFGKAPLLYIKEAHHKMGNTFTLYIAGKRMTYLFNPEDYDAFFNGEPVVNFQEAVKPFTKNAAGIDSLSFDACHRQIHDLVKGSLAPNCLDQYVPSLSKHIQQKLAEYSEDWEQHNLLHVSREIVFSSAVSCLFGNAIDDPKRIARSFFAFDHDFEYGCQLPPIFLKNWAKARAHLISVLQPGVDKVRQNPEGSTGLFKSIVETSDAKNAVNYALLMLWASQANTIPAIFWTIAFLVNNPSLYTRAVDEVRSVLKPGEIASGDHLRQTPFIKRCVLETIRLRSPGMITRKVMKDQKIGGYTVPAGDLLMVSPYWSHRNPKFFPDPDTFHPDRWESVDIEKGKLLDGFIGFGGGRFQCPGRWFALNEMYVCISMMLASCEWEAVQPLPDPSPLHLVGVQEPSRHYAVRFRRL